MIGGSSGQKSSYAQATSRPNSSHIVQWEKNYPWVGHPANHIPLSHHVFEVPKEKLATNARNLYCIVFKVKTSNFEMAPSWRSAFEPQSKNVTSGFGAALKKAALKGDFL